MKQRVLAKIVFFILLLIATASYGDYRSGDEVDAFIDKMVEEHQFDRRQLHGWLAQAEKKQTILDAISRPAEKTLTWDRYRRIFLGQDRIDQGVQFWLENQQTLERAQRQFNVPVAIIVAIIGVETRFGRHKGSYRVIDALATLGFDYPPRAAFFRKELESFFLLAREQKQDPLSLTGSYAGAMGYGQFIPSSYRAYAVDFDHDGVADIWNNPVDAIGSVANYFHVHGWQYGEPVFADLQLAKHADQSLLNQNHKPSLTVSEAKSKGFELVSPVKHEQPLKLTPLQYQNGDELEYLAGFDNFYVITRYNRSRLYARAAWELAQAIEAQYAKVDAETKVGE